MRFTKDPIYPDEQLVPILDDGCILTVKGVVDYLNWYRNDMRKFSVENESLKIENRELMAYNSALEDTLLNVDVVLHRLIDKYCNNNDDRDVSICEVLHEFKKEIFPSTIQPEFKPIFSPDIKPILGPVGRCIPIFEIKKEKPEEILKKALEGIK